MTGNPYAKKIGCTMFVSERSRRHSPIDEVQRAEERALAEVVMKVHAERMVGTSWPVVQRFPVRWQGGEPRDLTPQEIHDGVAPDEWRVHVYVMAVPRVDQ